jgi:hypothetical protein
MTAKQRIHLEAAEAGLEILDDNNSVWTGNAAWTASHTELVDQIELIYTTDAIGVTDNTGAARSKKTIRIDTGALANQVCGPLKKFFVDIDDPIQGVTIEFSLSQLTYASQTNLTARWKKIVDVANANPTFLTGGYGVTSGMLTAITNGRTDFMTITPTPKALRATKNAAKLSLKTEFKELKIIVTGFINLSQSFRATNLSFVEALLNAFGLDNSGNRLENAVFTFRDTATNVAIDKVKVTFTKGSLTFIQYSTKRGLITVKGKAQGNWTMLIEAETYLSQTITNVAFDPTKPILKMLIKLVKA